MATVTFSSVAGTKTRSIFTEFGPIVKKTYLVGSSNDAVLKSQTTCLLPSIFLDVQSVGRKLHISGSPFPENNGTFTISAIEGNTVTLSDSAFRLVDESKAVADIIRIANDLKHKYNSHRVSDSHIAPDNTNTLSLPDCVDITTAVTLLNTLRSVFLAHFPSTVFHLSNQPLDFVPEATGFDSAVFLLEELFHAFRLHVQDLDVHTSTDLKNYARSGPLVISQKESGPLQWELLDEKRGIIADLPSDVTVRVGGVEVEVERVFGLLGLIVLKNAITPGSTVEVYYDYLKNPEIGFGSLNDFSYTLNQWGNNKEIGVPFNFIGNLNNKTYQVSSYLSNSKNIGVAKPAELPLLYGWKFKGFSREYSAGLNDPNRLLLNSPVKTDTYSVFTLQDSDRTVYYFPTELPEASGWTKEGDGESTISDSFLKITDSNHLQGIESRPPFFYKSVDMKSDSLVYSSFRFKISDVVSPSGVFTGVSFGFIQDGKACVVGAIETLANNLSSAIVLANEIRSLFESHVLSTGYHYVSDPSSVLPFRDADDLPSLLNLLNALQNAFNSHVSAPQVHSASGTPLLFQEAQDLDSAVEVANNLYSFTLAHFSDAIHKASDPRSPGLVKQIGVYLGGPLSEASSWSSFAHDWSIEKTVRIVQEDTNSAGIFLTDYIGPVVSVQGLPLSSSLPFRIDSVSGVYFGSVGNFQGNTSFWNHAHFSILPYVDTTVGTNKSVIYTTNVLPEFSSDPWIPVGQEGSSKILSSSLIIDSSSSVPEDKAHELGTITGAFIGYLKVENAILPNNTFVCDFGFSSSSWTHGVDKSSLGFHVEDGDLSVSLSFLQGSPSPARVLSSVEPFGITLSDTLDFKIDSDSHTVVFDGVYTTAAAVSTFVNSKVGFSLTSASSGVVAFESLRSGSSHSIVFSASSGLSKLGIEAGKYQGKDTNPETVVSWSGFEFPSSNEWVSFGTQNSEIIDRKMRLSDSSTTDFISYQCTSQSLKDIFSGSWKTSFKLSNEIFIPSLPISASSVFSFCGASVLVDESATGKNLEVHFSIDENSNPYLVVYSFDYALDKLVFVKSMPCAWTTGAHTVDVYTNKVSGNITFLFDGIYTGSVPYSLLLPGSTTSAVFGSGSPDSSNANTAGARSAWTWEFLSVYSDKKISDPNSVQNRYVAVFAGGDETSLDSYYKVQHDWSSPSSYRLIKDPNKGVLVFINGASSPSISIPYNSIKLPPSSTSTVKRFGLPGPSVSFGAFSGTTISRSSWTNINYSAGKVVTPGRRIPQSMTLNRANVITSFEHQVSQKKHTDYTTSVSSSGSPDYLTLDGLDPYLKLVPGTPPVQMTENLENRGGLQISIEKVSSLPASSVVSRSGLTNVFVDDPGLTGPSLPSYASNLSALVNRANELKSKANAHYGSSVHVTADVGNVIATLNATDLASSITLVNACRSSLILHFANVPSHVNPDVYEPIPAVCSDYTSCVSLVDALFSVFDAHRLSSSVHSSNDYSSLVYGPTTLTFGGAVAVLNDFKSGFNAHLLEPGVHTSSDLINTIISPNAVDLATFVTLATEVHVNYLAHIASPTLHMNADTSNQLSPLSVVTENDAISFANEVKSKYNAHVHEPAVHLKNDDMNLVFTAVQASLPMNIVLLNELKAVYNAHSLSTRYHLIGGATQVLSADATDLASAIVLADDIRVTFNDHKTFPGVHFSNDNSVFSDPSPTDLDTLSSFTLGLKKNVLSHLSKRGIHGRNDTTNVLVSPAAVDLSTAYLNLTELHSKFNAHILSIQSHKEPDYGSTTLLSYPSSFNSAKTSFEEVKTAFLNHIPSITFHVNGDTTYPSFTDITDVASLCSNIELLKTAYSNHLTSPGVHGNDDLTPVVSLSAYSQVFSLVDEIAKSFPMHQDSLVHNGNKDSFGFSPLTYSLPEENYSIADIDTRMNECAAAINYHMSSAEHDRPDQVHKIPLPLSFANINQTYASLSSIKSGLNDHILGKTYHLSQDLQSITTVPVANVYELAHNAALVLVTAYNSHKKSLKSHVRVNAAPVPVPPPYTPSLSNLPDLVSSVNALKASFNAHIVDNNHLSNDPSNTVSAPDCTTSVNSIVVLLNDISSRFSAHGTAPDVHSGMVLVTLESPDRVIYQSMDFIRTEEGTSEDNSTFVDESS